MRRVLICICCVAMLVSLLPGCNGQERGEAFFDHAAFIGDSISMKLQNYHAEHRVLGDATFLTAGSYSVGHAVNGTLMLTYRGQQMAPEDALAACGAKRVFILLGMNDIALYGVDGTLENWATLVSRIRDKNPRIEVYIQSGTPIYAGGEKGQLTNSNMDRYNRALKQFAEAHDCRFVDIASGMKDENGALKASFCSDQYVHLTDAACEVWVGALKKIAGG